MFTHTPEALLHTYGIISGMLLAAFMIPLFLSVTYFCSHARRMGLAFLLFSLPFICFWFYLLLFQSWHHAVTQQVLPQWLFDVGRVLSPIAIITMTFLYTRTQRMRSVNAYEISLRLLWYEYGLYALNIIMIFVLLYQTDTHTIVLLTVANFIPASVGGLLLALVGSKNSSIARFMVGLFGMLLVICVIVSIIAFKQWFVIKEPLAVALHFYVALTATLFCLMIIRFAYPQVEKYINIRSLDRFDVVNEMIKAVDDDQFFLQYQPQLCLKTNEVSGVEALMRWQHPTKGLITPNDFIHLAEHVNLIDELTKWLIERATRDCARLQCAVGVRPITMSINLSPKNLNTSIVKHLAQCLKTHNVAAGLLNVEITETIMLGQEGMGDSLQALKDLYKLGVGLSVDDYGTGFSSLSYFKKFTVNELKIDRSFVFDLAHNLDSFEIVKSTVQMAHNLGIRSVAEGVETQDALKILRRIGCSAAQGYAIARPLNYDVLLAWLGADKDETQEMLALTL